MARRFKVYNGAMPTTGLTSLFSTGTGPKTLVQVAPPSGRPILVRAWGLAFDGAASAAGVKCELLQTDVAATVTAHVASGLHALDSDGLTVASAMTLGTGATGFNGTVEGSITATRVFDLQYVNPAGGYSYQWALGDEPQIEPGKFLRVRVNATAAVNVAAWIAFEE